MAGAASSAEAAFGSSIKADTASIDAAAQSVANEAGMALSATISRALGGRASFANIIEPTVAVSVDAGSSDEAAAVADLQSMESRRSAAEGSFVAGVKAELRELAKTIIAAYDREIRAHKSFLGAPRKANIRIVTDPSYPSVTN